MIRLEDRSAVLHDGIWVKHVSILNYELIDQSYITYKIRLTTIGNDIIELRRRYSDFEKLRVSLISEVPNESLSIPQLPPKTGSSILHNNYFLMKRLDSLDYFLKCVLLNPYTAESEAVKWFMRSL